MELIDYNPHHCQIINMQKNEFWGGGRKCLWKPLEPWKGHLERFWVNEFFTGLTFLFCLFLFSFFLSFFFTILKIWPGNSLHLPLLIINDKSLTFTWSWEWWEDAEMTLERSVHHLSCGGIQHVKTVFSHQVALAIRFSGEHDGALGALEGLLTWKRIKKKIFLKSVVWQQPIFNEIIFSSFS